MKVLNLVLHSNRDDYNQMKEMTERYYSTAQNVTTVYYQYSDSITTEYELSGNTLYIKGVETYTPGIVNKTLAAFKYFNYDEYDYIVRSNISTIINFSILIPALESKPLDYGSTCAFGNLEWYGDMVWGTGTSIIFSRKTMQYIVENITLFDAYDKSRFLDDVCIGYFVRDHMPHVQHIQVLNLRWVPNFRDKPEELKAFLDTYIPTCAAYRNHNGDRSIDIEQMKQILGALEKSVRVKINEQFCTPIRPKSSD